MATITRPAYRYNYSVSIILNDILYEMAFSSVSGGEIEFDTVEEHIDSSSHFKTSSTGRASISDLVCELGCYRIDGNYNNVLEDISTKKINTQQMFHQMLIRHMNDEFKVDVVVQKVSLENNSGENEIESIIYEDCIIKMFNFGDFDATAEEILIQQITFKPNNVKHNHVDSLNLGAK